MYPVDTGLPGVPNMSGIATENPASASALGERDHARVNPGNLMHHHDARPGPAAINRARLAVIRERIFAKPLKVHVKAHDDTGLINADGPARHRQRAISIQPRMPAIPLHQLTTDKTDNYQK